MYFSLEPKKNRKDLYDREKELSELENAVKNGRITLLAGIRRIGKTSLLQVFLEERKAKGDIYAFLDCRSFIKGNRINKADFNAAFIESIENSIEKGKLKNLIKTVSKVSTP